MLSKNDLLDAMLREIAITKHLMTKVEAGGESYRPTEGQRSVLELVRYLAFCGMGGTVAMADGNWEGYKAASDAVADATWAELPTHLDNQAAALTAYYGELSDVDFASKEATTPLGDTMTLGRALLELPVKWMTAYRMQLYLYLKFAGNTEIWTPNCWGGVDMERPSPA